MGEAIAYDLRAMGARVTAFMRRDHAAAAARLHGAGIEVARLDLNDTHAVAEALSRADMAAFTPILTLTAPAIASCAPPPRLIVFSSNNVSMDPDAPVYRKLRDAEDALRRHAPHAIILRPTLIYGDPRLRAIPQVMAAMRRLPAFPMPGSGRALQQPVHVRDLARLAATIAQSGEGKTYAVGGPERMTTRAFYQAIMRASGIVRPIVATPGFVFKAARAVLGARFPLDEAQLARLEKDRRAPDALAPPEALAPQTRFADGLAELARALGHVRSNT